MGLPRRVATVAAAMGALGVYWLERDRRFKKPRVLTSGPIAVLGPDHPFVRFGGQFIGGPR